LEDWVSFLFAKLPQLPGRSFGFRLTFLAVNRLAASWIRQDEPHFEIVATKLIETNNQ
jgi:hypothetical protein